MFSSITESSLWSEAKEVRLLFVSMLARADAVGFVEAALPGLARLSNLSLPETESAIVVLESPDPHSKNPSHEGRRVLRVDGGWVIINYEEYRGRRSEDERREYMRTYMKEYRSGKQSVNNGKQIVNTVNHGKPPLAQAEAEAEAEAKKKESVPPEVEFWNSTQLPKTQVWKGQRFQKLQTRRRDEFFSTNWREAITKCAASNFCTGNNDRGWRATFDWFLQPDSVARIMEGKYGNRNGKQTTRAISESREQIQCPVEYRGGPK